MSVRVRFAPSPTGFLHVGGARTALYNWLHARGHGGTFVLRIEDTDAARSTDESVSAILDSMRWLGLTWDEGPEVGGAQGPYFQSQRRALYRQHAEALVAAGKAYACFCTPDELEARRGSRIERGEASRYDGRCRRLGAAERAALAGAGHSQAIRFALDPAGATAWPDILRGTVAFQNENLDDFVLLRADGLPTYNFACVVDDHVMEITDVIRGDDHISNTPRQLLLYAAFDWTPPRFAHVPMILGADGTRLSKRHGATSVATYRDMGYLPAALDNFLALLGWAYDGTTELFSLAELQEKFRLARVGANPAIFNTEKLEWMNGQHLKRLDESTRVRLTREFLERRGHDLSNRSAEWQVAFVRALGDRLKTLADAETYGEFVLRAELKMDEAAWAELRDRPRVDERLEALAQRLEHDGEFSVASLEREIRALASELGIKAGELVGVARVALTGKKASFGIFEVLWLLGRERAVERLRAAAARWHADSRRAEV